MKKILSVMAIIITATVVFSGCRKTKPEQSAGIGSQKVPIVMAAEAIEGSISKTLELSGSVTATKVARMG
ncbi:MAG: hypothetical protein JXA81_09150, partial [Sedimentisphaerales bacterium]|nr:hypothetical protein [Sedimentisphaerales bacterium]